ncbi:hypothetical protein XENOCAPTIV_006311, partial [Xenoophorus captivus]
PEPVRDGQQKVIFLQRLHSAERLVIQGNVAASGIVQQLLLGGVKLSHLGHFLWGHEKQLSNGSVVMDVLGVTSLLLGVFASIEIKGKDFGDMLVYSGALLVLFSMAGWVLWYSGNIEGLHLQKDLNGGMGSAVDRLARTLSRRIRLPRTHSSPT